MIDKKCIISHSVVACLNYTITATKIATQIAVLFPAKRLLYVFVFLNSYLIVTQHEITTTGRQKKMLSDYFLVYVGSLGF